MFWDVFTDLCKQKKVTPNGVAGAIGLSNATCTKWKQGATPGGKNLQKIADYFGVTTSHLLGESTPTPPQPEPEPEKEKNADIEKLTDICEYFAKTKAGAARLQLLVEEAERLKAELNQYEKLIADIESTSAAK